MTCSLGADTTENCYINFAMLELVADWLQAKVKVFLLPRAAQFIIC